MGKQPDGKRLQEQRSQPEKEYKRSMKVYNQRESLGRTIKKTTPGPCMAFATAEKHLWEVVAAHSAAPRDTALVGECRCMWHILCSCVLADSRNR